MTIQTGDYVRFEGEVTQTEDGHALIKGWWLPIEELEKADKPYTTFQVGDVVKSGSWGYCAVARLLCKDGYVLLGDGKDYPRHGEYVPYNSTLAVHQAEDY